MHYFFLVCIYGLCELLSLIITADAIGALLTFILMVIMMLIGGWMLRNIGISAALMTLGALRNGAKGLTWYQMLFPIRYIAAAVMFMIPGFIGDFLGILLLLPFGLPEKLSGKKTFTENDNIIDGEFHENGNFSSSSHTDKSLPDR